MIGYYLGSLGEMQISTNLGFKLVPSASGAHAYPLRGSLATLTARPDESNSWGTIGIYPAAQYQSCSRRISAASTLPANTSCEPQRTPRGSHPLPKILQQHTGGAVVSLLGAKHRRRGAESLCEHMERGDDSLYLALAQNHFPAERRHNCLPGWNHCLPLHELATLLRLDRQLETHNRSFRWRFG